MYRLAHLTVALLTASLLAACGSHSLIAENGMMIEKEKAVDLGLNSKTLWAGWNIGAKKPEGYGKYFSWGETKPKKKYTWANYKLLKSNPDDKDNRVFSKYTNETQNSLIGDSKTDVATAKWGNDWCMPTQAQINELLRDCEWTWTKLNGVNGYAVKGPNGKSIFMPAAGTRFESIDEGEQCFAEGKTLYYWCGELDTSRSFKSKRAYCLIYEEDYGKFYDRNGDRCDGKTVRAVRRQTK